MNENKLTALFKATEPGKPIEIIPLVSCEKDQLELDKCLKEIIKPEYYFLVCNR